MKQKSHFPKKNGFLLKKLLLYLFLKRVKIRTFLELMKHFSPKNPKKSFQTAALFAESACIGWLAFRRSPTLMQSFRLFLHHLPHAFSPFCVGDVDEIDACWQTVEVDLQAFTLARDGGYTLAKRIDDFRRFQVLAHDGDLASGGVRVEGGEGIGDVFFYIPRKICLA